MPLQTLLDLSTGHLPKRDLELLGFYQAAGNRAGMALVCYPYEYGWTVSTSGMLAGEALRFEKIDAIRREGFSEYFVNIMNHAAEKGASLIRFDADAEYEPDLPHFEDGSNEPVFEDKAASGPRP